MQLVDEDDELPLRGGDLLEQRLEALLELAAELGAGDQRGQVERDELFVAQRLRHVAVDDALGEPFDDGRLADAGLADEHRVVLGAPRQHLNHAANLLVATDHGVELAGARGRGEVARVLLHRLVLVFGGLVRHAVRASHGLQRLEQRGARNTELLQQDPRFRALRLGQREQQVLGRHEGVLQLSRFVVGSVEDLVELAGETRLRAALLGIARDLLLNSLAKAVHIDAELVEERDDDPLGLAKQREQQVPVVDERIAVLARERNALVECLGGFHREAISIQHV